MDTTAGTTTATATPNRFAVGLVEAYQRMALVGHRHVTKAEQESTLSGLA